MGVPWLELVPDDDGHWTPHLVAENFPEDLPSVSAATIVNHYYDAGLPPEEIAERFAMDPYMVETILAAYRIGRTKD